MSADDRADLYASISFGRPASGSVGVPEYPAAVFTHVPTDVVTGDGSAADLVATPGTREDAHGLGERHVTGDQRDVASASETDGSVDVPVHTQDAGDGSSPTRTPPVVSGTPPSSAPARSDVDDRVHEHRSALPPEPVRDPDDGTPAQPMAAPEFVSPTLPPPPSAAELRAVLDLYAGDVDDVGPAAPLASAQSPSGITASPPVGTDVRDDLVRTDDDPGPPERERAAPDLPGADVPSAAELRAVLDVYSVATDYGTPVAPLASEELPGGTAVSPPVGTDVHDDLACTDDDGGAPARERAAPDLPGADPPPPPSSAELRAVLDLYAGDADDGAPALAHSPSGTAVSLPVGTDVRDGVHDDLACTDDDSGAPARERAAPDLPGADPPPPPSSAELRAVLDLYAGDADDGAPALAHSPSGTAVSLPVGTDVRDGAACTTISRVPTTTAAPLRASALLPIFRARIRRPRPPRRICELCSIFMRAMRTTTSRRRRIHRPAPLPLRPLTRMCARVWTTVPRAATTTPVPPSASALLPIFRARMRRPCPHLW